MTTLWRRALLATASTLALSTTTVGPASAQEIQLDGIIVTFSRTMQSAIDAMAGSSTIGREQMDEQFQPSSITEVLSTIPGVSTDGTTRDPGVAVNIRGLQDFGRVNMLIEGARQNFQRSSHGPNGVMYVEPEMLQRVDITRGPTATIYGSGAIGGVAAFELLDADAILRAGEYAAIRNRTTYSTNGNGWLESVTGAARSATFDVVGQLNGRWDGNYKDGNGTTVRDTEKDVTSGMVKARWRPAIGHQITGTVVNYNADFMDWAAATSGTRRTSELENLQFTLGYTFKRDDTPMLDFSAKAYRNSTLLTQTRIGTGTVFEPIGSRRSFDVVTTGFDVFNTSRFNFGGGTTFALTYGVDGFEDKVVTSDPNGGGDELTPSGRRSVVGAFVQGHLKLGMVDVISALRYDSYELEGGGTKLSGDRVSPKITVGVTPVKGFQIFGTYAEGYRAPAVTETLINGLHPLPAPFPLLPNPNLKPETAQTLEAGVNLKYDNLFRQGDAFRAKFVAFHNEVQDYIGFRVVSPDPVPFGTYQYQNFTSVTLDGVELEATYDARTWFIGLAASHIRGTDDDTGLGLSSVPADQIVVTGGVRMFDNKLVAGGRVRFVASQHRVADAALASDAYNIVDLFGQYIVSDSTTLNLNINNLFDVAYRPFLTQLNDPGFNARLGVTIRLGAN
ncbi:TonB-dependent hemoglobin/transferrin/lactoferrin family receptor [Hyphomicrobium sp. CS1BSMeth3]|uniref:TonB-dependent hemoglobin/transferrin/lactoferrin family receptor n=1 Tax=Hyphomicrobium sp. CS1BSMeth3 TaxID=1892844 RepID=UPI000931FC65|nr:TonB-dependent hemoglobin/transferrin/lactoferrin family receptor [Hyphomicrobium sp. CS1BSMeth3]